MDLAQKFGVLSIGEAVCRDFGPDGIFYGTINAYRRETTGELYLEGLQRALGDAYKDPRDYTGVRSSNSGGKYVFLKKNSQQGIPKNIYTIPYLMWAYVWKKKMTISGHHSASVQKWSFSPFSNTISLVHFTNFLMYI